MTSIASASVSIRASAHSVLSLPCWLGEVTVLAHHLQCQRVLATLKEQVRFARRRFGHFAVIDFLAVLFGYAISGEETLAAFSERLQPWASPFMALFERGNLPSRSALARFLAALTVEPVEVLRPRFLSALLARPLGKEDQPGGLGDRAGKEWLVFAVDGTREAARQRTPPKMADWPAALCAWVSGAQAGEVVPLRSRLLRKKREKAGQAQPCC